VLPAGLDQQRELGPDWARWLDGLPRVFAGILDEWALSLDPEAPEDPRDPGAPGDREQQAAGDQEARPGLWHGFCSLVAPVVTEDGTAAVLKVSFDGDDESVHEALALQHWHGDGTVRLLRADPRRRALLLERLDRRSLMEVWDLEACEIVASLYPRIHVPALPQLASVTSYVERWLADLAAQPRDIPIPYRYREQAQSLGRDLVADPAGTGRIVHGDLHYANVLAAPPGHDAERGEWLVIDPKPMSGDPHYEPAPMLWNRWDELAGDVRGGLRRRFHALVDAAGLDEDRARDWVVVRMVLNASWAVEDAQRMARQLSAEEREWITRCIAICKAVQD
jgi:streptomycin 6-kinase